MRKIILLFLFTCLAKANAQANEAEAFTHAYYYIYSYFDETNKLVSADLGETWFDVYIGADRIVLSVEPEQVFTIVDVISSDAHLDGTLVILQTYDQNNVGCKVSLYVTPDKKEIHFTYLNVIHCYLLRDE